MHPFHRLARAVAIAAIALSAATTTAALAEDKAWSVSKSSGEVWVTSPGAQQVSLGSDAGLKPGDAIRTGRNGRVLLVRGEETILVSPNSAIAIPAGAPDGLATRIVQQAGSILLDVEKRNVKHFEVETPYLAAVVKGTRFSVTVSATGTRVNVSRGQVEVADFRSGQIAQVMPGQFATSLAQGKAGLSLSGTGSFAPIAQGSPRAPSVERLMVPKNGLSAPRNAANQPARSLGAVRAANVAPARPGASAISGRTAVELRAAPRGLRIASPIGEVRLNFQKATSGLARSASTVTPSGRAVAARETTIWSRGESRSSAGSAASAGNASDSDGNGRAGSAGNASGAAAVAASARAAVSISPTDNSTAAADSSGRGNNTSSGNTGGSSASNNGNGNSGRSNSGNGNNGPGNSASNSNSGGNGNGSNSNSNSNSNSGANGGNTNSGRGNSGNGNSANASNTGGSGNGNNGNGNGNSNSGNGNGNNGNGNHGNGNNGNGNNGNGNGGVGNGNGNGNAKH